MGWWQEQDPDQKQPLQGLRCLRSAPVYYHPGTPVVREAHTDYGRFDHHRSSKS
jgi:hypothetical protein